MDVKTLRAWVCFRLGASLALLADCTYEVAGFLGRRADACLKRGAPPS